MSLLKIQNFGPIKQGMKENKGFIEIKKVTIFIGSQATGKSTIAKVYSTFLWLEKALLRGDIKESYVTSYNRFIKEFCNYQGLKSYFKDKTYLHFKGKAYSFIYKDKKLSIKKEENNYLIPQIMYVPAERNFLSLVNNPEKLKQLPSPLYTFLEEFENAKKEETSLLKLPINNLSFQFKKQNKKSMIIGDSHEIMLSEASSGIQSLLPLYLVSKYLSSNINKEHDSSTQKLSIENYIKLKKDIEKIFTNNKLSKEVKEVALELVSSKWSNECFINIVEEPEQNLFPESQKKLLESLFEFVNTTQGNELIITTHSPYIINYLTLSIKGRMVLDKITDNDLLKSKLNEIVSSKSCIDGEEAIVYELIDGEIKLLPTYHNMPSDNNYLNNFLDETNDSFNKLLDIEELI